MTRLLAALEWHLLINNPIRSIRSWYVTNYTVEVDTRSPYHVKLSRMSAKELEQELLQLLEEQS